jgi:hydroxymethylbilane synthase
VRFSIKVGARDSALSQCQITEVLSELKTFHPLVEFDPLFVKTTGDLDLKTSLRNLDKTDFFTKEVDVMQLSGKCRIAIHSAKDLPDPLPQGLAMIALTRGVDPSDVLVSSYSISSLPFNAKIGTSSLRRMETILSLRSDLLCVDIRGTIPDRLAQLDAGHYDAVVMAEAALIRLGLTHRSRIALPGPVAPLQGQLAILAQENDQEMQKLFACLDCR